MNRIILSTIILTILLGLQLGCASTRQNSELKSFTPALEIHPSTEAYTTARIIEKSGKIYVTGSVSKRPGVYTPQSTHIDVQLLDSKGRTIAETMDRINSTTGTTRHSYGKPLRFVTSFNREVASSADKILVILSREPHPKPHNCCVSCNS
jgi:hypothetical protein